eukprot:6281215-Prymnesium_polylepis.1
MLVRQGYSHDPPTPWGVRGCTAGSLNQRHSHAPCSLVRVNRVKTCNLLKKEEGEEQVEVQTPFNHHHSDSVQQFRSGL